MSKYVYIFDSKLYAYNEIQRGSPLSSIFNTMAKDLFRSHKKGKIYVTFDIGKSSYRLAEESYYKGDRRKSLAKKSQEEIDQHTQFNLDYEKLVPLFRMLGVTVLAVKGVEADDLVSLVALRHPDSEVTIMTADRDHLHSVVGTDNVFMFSGRENKTFNHDYVVEEYGTATRKQFTLLKAIQGDDGDTLKAFRNIGPVKARKLFNTIIEKYPEPSIEDIVNEIEQYMEKNTRIAIHEYHIEEGRTTVREVIESNFKVGATFEDLTKLTNSQIAEYNDCFLHPINTDYQAFLDKSMEVFGYPIMLDGTAKRVFNVR